MDTPENFFLAHMLRLEQRKVEGLNTTLERRIRQRTRDLSEANEALTKEIEERGRIESALRESRKRLKILFDFARNGYCMLDGEGRFIEVNLAAEKISGYRREELVGRSVLDFEIAASHAGSPTGAAGRAALKGLPWGPGEFRIRRKDGDEAVVEVATHPVALNGRTCVLVTIRDITDLRAQADVRKKLEEQLAQSRKMEAIGTLAGGIAHDFNNILASIIGYTELSLADVKESGKLKANLQAVYQAGMRARDLVRQILTFARQTDEEVRPVAIGEIVREVLGLLRATLPKTIEIRERIDRDARVMANPTRIHQILMNLGTNAAQAMEDSGGVMEVGLEALRVENPGGAAPGLLAPGQYLRLTVSDTGRGIAPENLRSVFEPYFTTKTATGGTGMGLAVVHAIVDECGGVIDVESEAGRGTTFSIHFPALPDPGAAEEPHARDLPRGDERILLVDDELPIANMCRQALSRLGYTVVIRDDSTEALALFEAAPGDFDLVVTDMTMPKMAGDRLAARLTAVRPDIPVILCTGYAQGLSDDIVGRSGVRVVIHKPVTIEDLGATVRRVLDDARPPAKQR